MKWHDGKTIPLSLARRAVCDILHFSRKVPLVAGERRLDMSEVVQARRRLVERPSWFAVFLKAYALVTERHDELRRSYLSFPRPRLFQHARNVAALAVPREIDGDEGVLGFLIRSPECLSLSELDGLIRRARTAPIESIKRFRRQLRVARWPWPIRRLVWWAALQASGKWRERSFGTFAVTSVGALGAAALSLLSPLTSTLTYGVFEKDDSVLVRLFFDHRVLDGALPSRALELLQEIMSGPILAELRNAEGRIAA